MPTYNPILRRLSASVNEVMKVIPASEKSLVDRIQARLKSLDLTADGKIKTTAKNLSVITSIQNEINRITSNPAYSAAVKNYIKQFREISALHNEYWRTQESKFKPPRILKQLRQQSINDILSKLTGDGYRANVTDSIRDVLRRNITTGGSYADLTKQLRDMIRNTRTPGILSRYIRQVTTDAINQYSAQYNQLVSADLGYKWFSYDGSDIVTTRPFCDAMTDQPYFHISEVPRLLRAEGLTYTDKNGQRVPVPIYEKTGLPNGMIPGTNVSNFIVNRGGYNCGHQIRPVSEDQVPMDVKAKVMSSPSYKAWASAREGEQLSLFNDKRLEKFTVGYAPFREGDISNISKADAAFDNKKFIEWRKMGTELADMLGINIIDDQNSIGVYAATSNNAEASRILMIEADPALAELYAAMMGTLAPDVQNSVMLNRYSDKGEQTEYYINFDSKSAAVSFVNNRRNYGIEDISLLPDNDTVLVLDFGGFNHDKLLTDYGEEIKGIEERKVETRFIGENDYGKILSEARSTLQKHYGAAFGKALDDFLKLADVRFKEFKGIAVDTGVLREGIVFPVPTVGGKYKPVIEIKETDTVEDIAKKMAAIVPSFPISKFDVFEVNDELSTKQATRYAKEFEKLLGRYRAFEDYPLAPEGSSFNERGEEKPNKFLLYTDGQYGGYVTTNRRDDGVPEWKYITELNFGSRILSEREKSSRGFFIEPGEQYFLSKVDTDKIDISSVTHEFAHTITTSRNPSKTPAGRSFWVEMENLQNQYLREMNRMQAQVDAINDKLARIELHLERLDNRMGAGSPTVIDAKKAAATKFEKLLEERQMIRDKIQKTSIGRYGTDEGVDEFWAESFTEYRLNSKPSRYAVRAGAIGEKYFKRK